MLKLNWKYRYFRKKLKGVAKMVLDLEFKRFKTLEIREEIRGEYDVLKSKRYVLEAQIQSEKEKPTMKKGEAARLDDQKVLFDRDISRFEEQMKALDLEVYGSKPTQEYPEGVQGIVQQIDALQELKVMLSDYMKSL